MMLLSASILLFFIVIGLIIYANWPASTESAYTSCGRRCGGGCPRCPCNRCGEPKPRCRCATAAAESGGCSFC